MSKRVSNQDNGAGVVERKPVKTKRERFLSLAERRVNRAIKSLRAVERMASKTGYEYREDEAVKIINAIGVHAKRCMDAFAGQQQEETGFRL